MSERHLEEDVDVLGGLIERMGRRFSLRDPLTSAVESLGLTPAQIHAVIWLGRDGPLSMGQLAQRCGVTEKTITGLVDRLEKGKLVRRERAESDRRVVNVALTPLGAEKSAALQESIRGKVRALFSFLEITERRELLRIITVLHERLETLDPKETP